MIEHNNLIIIGRTYLTGKRRTNSFVCGPGASWYSFLIHSVVLYRSAYELYADLGHNVEDSLEMAERFKETFSRDNVRVHFLGAWLVSPLVAFYKYTEPIVQGYSLFHWYNPRKELACNEYI
jgi:hypothetical protein